MRGIFYLREVRVCVCVLVWGRSVPPEPRHPAGAAVAFPGGAGAEEEAA